MGNIIRIINDQSKWISEKGIDITSTQGDISFSSTKKVILEGIENGRQIGTYNYERTNDKDFPYGWWTYDYEGKKRVAFDKNNNAGFRSYLEKTVYFQLEVNDRTPLGTTIQFHLYDYDTGLFLDWLNPDDKEFGGKQIIKTATVREVDGKKRITVELFLELIWKKELAEDRGYFRDGCLDFYWRWTYDKTDWNSQEIILRVYPSLYQLRLAPAFGNTYSLPEIYSNKGFVIAFMIGETPEGKIEKFIRYQVRVINEYRYISDIQKVKKEIYTETLNLRTNTLESANLEIVDVEHSFRVKNDASHIFIDERRYDVPVSPTSKIGVFNTLKKSFKVVKKAADLYGKFLIAEDFMKLIPEPTTNLKKGLPAISTFVGLFPGMGPISFGIAILEWISKDMIKEMNEWVDEQMWVSWQNTKNKGLKEAKSFIRAYWAITKSFVYYEISQNLLNKILKGELMNIDDLENNISKDSEIKLYTIFTYRVEEPEIDNYYDVIDCIFINE